MQDDCGAVVNQANSKVDFKRRGNEPVAHFEATYFSAISRRQNATFINLFFFFF